MSAQTVIFTSDESDEVENALVFFIELLERRVDRATEATDWVAQADYKHRLAVTRQALKKLNA